MTILRFRAKLWGVEMTVSVSSGIEPYRALKIIRYNLRYQKNYIKDIKIKS